ncbi:MAG: hypothetical protein IJ073_03780 [Lachnospiraceae bacterium]|nr:hypothetical protein [Lachnospiraceae bacterium]
MNGTSGKRSGYIVRQYDPSGEFVREYDSYRKAAEETGVKVICIQQTCYGKKRSAGGFVWKKGAEGELPERIEPITDQPQTMEAKPVRQRTPSGELVAVYASVNKAARAVGRGRKDVMNAATGRQKTCAGCIWDFIPAEEFLKLN